MAIVETVLIGALVLNALALTGLILLQQGRGASVGAAFGSGSANTVFGAQGSLSFIARMTGWLAVTFFVIAFALAWVAKERSSLVETVIPGLPTEGSDGAAPPIVPTAGTPAGAPAAASDVPAAPAPSAASAPPAGDVPAAPPGAGAPAAGTSPPAAPAGDAGR